ncbi:MAG TPA: arginine deiminase [Candidatus Chromulinivoraceae bacterium]|nr:arginine deiminase [Candidatus Chromulinivoraceae bacterium]
MDSPLHVTSEIGRLKTVLVHRPGGELENLTPDYLTELLFDDIPYLKKAQAEHDAFTQVLRDRDVEVLYLDQLAAEALVDQTIKEEFVEVMLHASKQGDTRITDALKKYLLEMNTLDMVRKIMAGVRKNELVVHYTGPKQLHEVLVNRYPFYLDPMPNLYFTRDPSAVIGQGLTINHMHWTARRRESMFMEYIIKHHPRFAGHNIPVWYDRDNRFSMEGGDELILSSEVMAIGISERTTAEAIERMAIKLFAGSTFKKILAIEIPKSHAFMHLDTVFTMIDHDKFTIHPAIQDAGGNLSVFVLEKNENEGEMTIQHVTNITDALQQALHKDHIELIPCGGGDEIAAAREQWNDGSNTLAIAPGVVVTYDRNYASNQALRDHGLEVIEVSGSELGRGRGGPRCMSMPLVREDI